MNMSSHLFMVPVNGAYKPNSYYSNQGSLVESAAVNTTPLFRFNKGYNCVQFVKTGVTSEYYVLRTWKFNIPNGFSGRGESFGGDKVINFGSDTRYNISYNPVNGFHYVGCWMWQEPVIALAQLSLGNTFTPDVINEEEAI